MKTTIDLPEDELAEAIRHTGAKTKTEAVSMAVAGADLVIAACAWEHGVEMEHDDAHLKALAALFD